jgi:hypothetical protein
MEPVAGPYGEHDVDSKTDSALEGRAPGLGEWKVVDPAGVVLWSRPRAGASEVGRLAASDLVLGRLGGGADSDGWLAVPVRRGGRRQVAWAKVTDQGGRALLLRVGKNLKG